MAPLRQLVDLLGLDRPVDRRRYITAGVSLMALKYAIDAIAIRASTGLMWTPVDYLLALVNARGPKFAAFSPGLMLYLLVWTLPFICVGVVLSVRRAQDARLPPWLVVLFFLPVLNYALMLALALWPSRSHEESAPEPGAGDVRHQIRRSTALGAIAGALGAALLVVIGVIGIRSYGVTLFLGSPFFLGVVSGFVANRIHPRDAYETALVVLLALAGIAGTLLLVAVEGAVCIAMAVPIAVPMALLGGAVGRVGARAGRTRGTSIAMIMALLPGGAVLDRALDLPVTRVVLTSVEIDAPASRVWRHVVAFDEIREAPAWYFRLGLAYPLRARIDGAGVGAMRLCEFTTGAFREPITVWDEPSRLAFDVAAQPAPLQEWSPYSRVYAPHVDGYFRTTHGEFRLVPLANGHTRLEGRTWYSLRIYPSLYWTPIAEAIVHRIHERVLLHVKARSEEPG